MRPSDGRMPWPEDVTKRARALLEECSSDEEDMFAFNYIEQETAQLFQAHEPNDVHRGSRPSRAANIDRGRQEGHVRILKDYFGYDGQPPTYTDAQFRRRYRMRRELFLEILTKLGDHDNEFKWRSDAVGTQGTGNRNARGQC